MQIENISSELQTYSEIKNSTHEILSFSKYLDNGFIVTFQKKEYLICSNLEFTGRGIRYRISLLNLKTNLDNPIFSTPSFLRTSIYDKIYISKMNNRFFVSYRIQNYACFLTLYQIGTSNLKIISNMRFANYAVKVHEDAISFLNTPFRCVFIPGSGTILLLDIKARKKLDTLSIIGSIESLKYNKTTCILAAKAAEEVYIFKILDDNKFSPVLYRIKVDEPFAGIPSAPDVPLVIAKFKDLKAFGFDEENQLFYTIYAWIMVDSRMVAPRISHLRIQRWKCEDKFTLEDVQDIEWNQNRTQKFRIIPELNLCILTGKKSAVLGLNGKILYEFNEKVELLSIHQNDVLYFCKSIPEL